ncbi:VOC family protein [Staphylococcus pettenkoferi]|uniref:VOC family protein n=1 Tax=Staphylococcus pettenkoferi TaxID=170573 RepID=UPI000CD31124|nr:VOC family protein [Staphylococcus pettenkoferi]MCI2803318.1 VOC family protein [Staphylococcus pettenkoferi]MCY1572897.1 VOC family protein [Staphylococcus pettenkoferi]MCY1578911.1 VOC family protein [Staphylococcus pettenkoferi]MCY1584493.1 VOC family protein [Staphylococcus pettenkoferi]MCY1615657.1 VOC family protein [Staphylococcus pettenkoferi]
MVELTGHHHISMYTKDARANKQFYTDVLGLKLVEKTVNQDNPRMYHLFYGDESGQPGTLLTFFEIPMAGAMRKSTNYISRLCLLVPDEQSLDYHQARLASYDITTQRDTYLGLPALYFEDRDGLSLVLVANSTHNYPHAWQPYSESTVPREYQIMGMGPVEFTLQKLEPTQQFLESRLGYKLKSQHPLVYTLDSEGMYSDIVLIQKDGAMTKPGRGYVHHIALATPDDHSLAEIYHTIDQLPHKNSGIIDRYFFKSLYYRQNAILFEFATTDPGFTVDTAVEDLGKHLNLPDFLEQDRSEIEINLKDLD